MALLPEGMNEIFSVEQLAKRYLNSPFTRSTQPKDDSFFHIEDSIKYFAERCHSNITKQKENTMAMNFPQVAIPQGGETVVSVKDRSTTKHQKQLERAEYNRREKKAKAEAQEALTWKFTVPSAKVINLHEVALTLSRENPIAYVTQKDFKKESFVVIHISVVDKARAFGVPIGGETFSLVEIPNVGVYAKVTSARRMGSVLKWAKEVRKLTWNKEEKTTFTVRYPDINKS